MEPAHVFALEQSLNTQWRQCNDYTTWLTMDQEKEATWIQQEDDYSKHLHVDGDQQQQVVYEAPHTKDDENTMACPVTGQRSVAASGGGGGVCPVTGQASEAAASTTCPVTGQTSSIPSACPMSQQQSMTCPVTGQKGATCPVSQS